MTNKILQALTANADHLPQPGSLSGLGDQMRELVRQLLAAGLDYRVSVCTVKRKFILQTLRASDGNQCRAARALQMHRNTLSRTISELGIRSQDYLPARGDQ